MVLSAMVLPLLLYKETILNNWLGIKDVYFYLKLEVCSYLELEVYNYYLTVKDIVGKVVRLIYIGAKRG